MHLHHFAHLSALLAFAGQPPPQHPLLALIDYEKVPGHRLAEGTRISMELFKVSFRPDFDGCVRYGAGHYDFSTGSLAFLQPRQVVVVAEADSHTRGGYALYFHPDLLRTHPLGSSIRQYGFFSYAVSEALLLSSREQEMIASLFNMIAAELEDPVDRFRERVLINHLERLLILSDRFYHRQFTGRDPSVSHALTRLDALLSDCLQSSDTGANGLPTAGAVATQLGMSQRYLSDLLQSLTGQTTQQYMQHHLVERSKELLSTSDLTVSEIAYRLGFSHPQSFSKLFKARTRVSPLEFRRSYF